MAVSAATRFSAPAPVGTRPPNPSNVSKGPVIAVVVKAMSTIIAKMRGESG